MFIIQQAKGQGLYYVRGTYMRGDPKIQNYLCSTGFPHYVSVLETHMCQRTSSRCERLRSDTGNFFEDFQHVHPFHDGWFMSASAHTSSVFSSFWPKTAWPLWPRPHPSHHSLDLTQATFFCFPKWKKSSKGNVWPMWKRWKQKKGRSTKRHQNRWVQKLFWAVEKMSW